MYVSATFHLSNQVGGKRNRQSSIYFPVLLVEALLLALPAPIAVHAQETQAEKILRNADTSFANSFSGGCYPDDLNAGGCCGSPGRRWCSTLPSCTDPGPNTKRTDPFDHLVVCELPKPSCSASFSDSQAIAARKTTPFDVTFYVTSDVHYWRTSFRLPDQVRHVRLMNEFNGLGTHWPAGIGFEPNSIPKPWGVLIAGDLTTFGKKEELGAYRLLYEQGTIADSIHYPVFPGLGNHDEDLTNSTNVRRMFDYVGDTMSCGTSIDSASHNYSWDWNQVHIIQLNEWAGYENTNAPDVLSSGMTWLANDLKNSVGDSERPVVIIQHLGCDSMSIGLSGGSNGSPTTCLDGDSNSMCWNSDQKVWELCTRWWTALDRQRFLDVLKPYNVVGLFTGHTHNPEVHRAYELRDNGGNSVIRVDNFVNGAGGTNDNSDGPGGAYDKNEGGHGEFYVVRITDSYLDVAPIQWTDLTPRDITDTQRQDQSGETTRISAHMSGSPPFKFNQPGCRKRIGDRFITAPANVYRLASAGGNLVSVTNISSQPIPGPLALRIRGATPAVSFVDSCVEEGNNNRSYVLFGLQLGDSLAAGRSVNVNAGVPFDAAGMELVVLTPIHGASTAGIDITVAPKTAVPGGSFTFYGPPNTDFFAEAVGGGGVPWLTNAPVAGTFDAFGRAAITYAVNTAKLPAQSSGSLTVAIRLNTSLPELQGTPYSHSVPFSLHFKAPVTVQLTAAPPALAIPGEAHVSFDAFLTHPQVTDSQLQTSPLPSGEVDLIEISPSGARTPLSRAFLGDQAIQNGVCNTYPQDHAVFGDDGVHGYCRSQNIANSSAWTFSLPVGMHTLIASYIGSGAGDAYYQPADSAPILYRVGQPAASIRIVSGGGQSTYTGVAFDNPVTLQVLDSASHPVPGAPLVILFPSANASAGFGGTAWLGITDANGLATSPNPIANGIAGTYNATVRVAEQNATASAVFSLTNTVPSGPPPAITASVLSKTTPAGSLAGQRQWHFNLRNTGGTAHGVQVTRVLIALEGGTPCAPVIDTPLPLTIQALPAGGSTSTGAITINFGSCAASSRFTLTVGVSANGGAYTNQTVIAHQFQ